MNLEQAFQISLVDFLARLGHHPTKVSGQKYLYISPYRNESTASFNVNIEKNRWYDFGTGEGGGIIRLVKRIYRIDDTSQALRLIQEQSPLPLSRHNKPPCGKASVNTAWKNVVSRPLSSYALLGYLMRRGIPHHIGQRYCREISYELNGRRYFALGFLNNSGGYELRNPYFKGCMGKKDITVLRSAPSRRVKVRVAHIFEGFISYMSYLALIEMGIFQLSVDEQPDYIILNSVANIGKVLPMLEGYDRILTYLDNDDAGKKATEVISGSYPDRVKDFAFIYDFYNDLNDYLCSFKTGVEGK